MIHLYTSSPPLGYESLLWVSNLYLDQGIQPEDEWKLNLASAVLVSKYVFTWGHISSEDEAPFGNLHKTLSCASKTLYPCI